MKPKHNFTLISLTVLMLLGFFLRFWQVSNVPSILNRDEAALAYNAFLLNETGMDEWQKPWPLILESFGDYKLPGYVVAVILSFRVLGYSDLAVRLPAVLAGTWLVALGYFFGRRFKLNNQDSLIVAGLLATAPVFIFYSRMAFEALLGLSIFITSFLLLARDVSKENISSKQVSIDLIALSLLLVSVFTYNTPFLLLPFITPVILVLRSNSWKNWVTPLIGILTIFTLSAYVFVPLSQQKSGITIFSDELVWRNSVIFREQFSPPLQPILGNKTIFFGSLITQRFINSFRPAFMVTDGGQHPWHSIPGYGNVVWIVYFLGLIGMGKVIFSITQEKRQLLLQLLTKKKKSPISKTVFRFLDKNKFQLSLIYLLLVSLLPSIVTVDAPHTTRSLLFLFIWHVFAVLGFRFIITKLSSNKKSQLKELHGLVMKGVSVAIALMFLFETGFFLRSYFVTYKNSPPDSLLSGFDTFIVEIENTYPDKKIAFVDDGGYQYISLAWYLRIPPATYFSTNIRQLPDQLGFRYGEQVTHYHFIAHKEDASSDETVIIGFEDGEWQKLNP